MELVSFSAFPCAPQNSRWCPSSFSPPYFESPRSLYQPCIPRYSQLPMLLFGVSILFFDLNSDGSATASGNPQITPSALFLSNPTTPTSASAALRPSTAPNPKPLIEETAIRGRPNFDWGQDLLSKIYRLSGMSRRDVGRIAQDRRQFHQLVERLCSLVDQT